MPARRAEALAGSYKGRHPPISETPNLDLSKESSSKATSSTLRPEVKRIKSIYRTQRLLLLLLLLLLLTTTAAAAAAAFTKKSGS